MQNLQFYARANDYYTATGFLNDIFDLFMSPLGEGSIDLSGTTAPSETGVIILSVTHLFGPALLQRDPENRHELTLNFTFRFRGQL